MMIIHSNDDHRPRQHMILSALVVMIIILASGVVILNRDRFKPSQADQTTSSKETSRLTVSRSDDARRLTAGSGSASFQNPCFSPNTTQLVYTRWRAGYNRGPADLILHDLVTGTSRVLVTGDDSANVNVPFGCWFGEEIIFASDRGRDGRDEIWVIRSDGTNLRQITEHTPDLAYIEPVFSPDGSHIAFELAQGETEETRIGHIAIVGRDGRHLQQLTDSSQTDDRLPSWSRDGKLLFQRRTVVDDAWTDWDIYLIEESAGGTWSTPKNISNQSHTNETDNSWDPTGQVILSSSDYGGLPHPNILAYRLAGGEPERLTISTDYEDGAPSLSPDGRWLAFESHRTDSEESPTDIWLKELSTPLGLWWQPQSGLSFQWQLTDLPVDTTIAADVYEIDGLDNPKSVVDKLHVKGRKVICYVNVGAWEDFRDDKDVFPSVVLGNVYQGFEDERWLDIRRIDLLAPILERRLDTCRDKGFDAVEADNVDGFEQETGFPLTADDQLRFNRWVAEAIHARGMTAALKNDGTQAAELVDDFDFVVTEECVLLDICDEYLPFRAAGKLQVNVEYTDTPITLAAMCAEARRVGMTSILKHRGLDRYRETCL